MWKFEPYSRCRALFAVSTLSILAGCSGGGTPSEPLGEHNGGGQSVDHSYAQYVSSQQSEGSEIAAVISQDAALAMGLNALQQAATEAQPAPVESALPDEPQLASAEPTEPTSPTVVVESTTGEGESSTLLGPSQSETSDSLQPSVISQQPTTPADLDSSDTSPVTTATLQPDSDADSETVSETPDTSSIQGTTDAQSSPSTGTPTTPEVAQPTTQSTPLPTRFESTEYPGFTGDITDAGVLLNWQPAEGTKGYNLYRNSQFLTTVFEPTYLDTDTPTTASNYYEAIAFDFNDSFSVGADGLTVRFREEPAPALPAHIEADYTLVFAEEFDTGALDPTVWNTSYLWGTDIIINQEEQYYVDVNNEPNFGYNPFVLDGETLTIRSIKTPPELSDKALGQPYLSGVITSYDSFKFTYGYVEARAKLPRGRGFWSAFWLLNAYYVDRKPEIDIMEHIGHDPDLVFHTYHYYDEEGNLRSTESSGSSGVDYTEDFHVFSVEWKPGTAIFYVDGVERHRISDSKMSSQEMYIIANTAIGGWWPGSPDETTRFPGEYTIDYIRAWQKNTPFNDVIFDDGIDSVPLAPANQERSPNHLPPFELWPEGYPERQ